MKNMSCFNELSITELKNVSGGGIGDAAYFSARAGVHAACFMLLGPIGYAALLVR